MRFTDDQTPVHRLDYARREPAFPREEIISGETQAMLSYALPLLGLPWFLIPLIRRNNTYALYHAKQVTTAYLLVLLLFAGSLLLAELFHPLGPAAAGTMFTSMLLFIIFLIAGVAKTMNRSTAPFPLIDPISRYCLGWIRPRSSR